MTTQKGNQVRIDPEASEAFCARRRLPRLRARLRELYEGKSEEAIRFRYGVIALDILCIAFFIAAPIFRKSPVYLVVDYLIALLLTVEVGARALVAGGLKPWFRRVSTWVDLVVLVTLLFPLWLFNFAFLRVMRLWSLLHSDVFWETVGRKYDDTRVEDTTKAIANLVTFIFVATGFVYASFARVHPGIGGYVDALYFTITALTTTGFGDIILPGTYGKLLAIVIMVCGITLFVNVAGVIIRPYKIRFRCPRCALGRHEPDAVHCKACGVLLNIPNDE